MNIFNSIEREIFEVPPVFNSSDQKKYFDFPIRIIRFMKTLRTPTNKVCFLVMFGYFKASKRFFSKQFHQIDITFVAKMIGFSPNQIRIDAYEEATYRRHKKVILEYYGYREFAETAKQTVTNEISSMIRSQLKPKLIMLRIIEILINQKIEIPSYPTLVNFIIDETKRHREKLNKIIESHLNPKIKKILDALLDKEDEQSSKVQRYKLTMLKKI